MTDHRADTGWKLPDTTKARKWLYGVMVAASPVVVAYGIVQVDKIGLWLVLAGAVLGITNTIAFNNVPKGDTK